MPTSRSYYAYLIESLKDPQEAAAYLNAVLEDGNLEELSLALKNVAEAKMAALSDAQLPTNQEAADHLVSQQTYLELSNLLRTLDELGFKLSVKHVA